MAIALQTTDGGVYSTGTNFGGGIYDAAYLTPSVSSITQDADVTRVFLIVTLEANGTTPTVSSATYGGVSASVVAESVSTSGGDFESAVYVYEVVEADLPAAGSGKTASVTMTAGGDDDCASNLAVVLLTGSGSQAVDGLVEDHQNTSGSVSFAVTPAVSGGAILSFACQNQPQTTTCNRTELYDVQQGGTNTNAGQIQLSPAASAQTQTFAWSDPGSVLRSAWVGFAVRDAGATELDADGTGAFEFATAGTAQLERDAAGTGAFELVTAGTATLDREASGTGAFELATSGTALLERDADGTGSFEFATAGTAQLEGNDADGTGAFEFATSGGATHAAIADVGLLDSGNSGVVTGGSGSVNVTVSSGNGNRKLLVGFTCESSANTAVASLTFNGQDLVGLGLEVPSSEANPDSFARTVFYEQFEGGMPANGTAALSFTFTSATGDKAIFYWLIDNARQDQLASGAANSVGIAGGAGTTIGTTITAGAAGAFIASVAYKNNTTGTLALTAPGSSTTDADLSGAGSGARLGGGHKAGSLAVGSNTTTWTHASEARRAISVALVNPVPEARQVGGGGSFEFATSGTAELGSQSAAGTGAFELSTAGTADRGRVADAANAFELVTAGTASSTLADGTGSFSFGTAGVAVQPLVADGASVFTFASDGVALGPGASGAVTVAPFTTSGTASVLVQADGTGAFEFATSGVAQTVQESAGTGVFELATAGTAAAVRESDGTGAFEFATAGIAELVPSANGAGAFVMVSVGTAEVIRPTTAVVRARDQLRVEVDSTDSLRTQATATTRLRVRVVSEDAA